MTSTTFLIHTTVAGAKLVKRYCARRGSVGEFTKQLTESVTTALQQQHSAMSDVVTESVNGVSFMVTTRARVEGQNRLTRRVLWDRQPRLA